MAGQTVIVSVLADTRRFNAGMAGTDRTLRRFSDNLRNVNRVGIAAFASIVYAVGRFTVEAVNAADAAEAIDRKLQNTAEQMRVFGKQTDNVVVALQNYAYNAQFVIGVDDDLIKSTQTVLLTFRNLAKTAGQTGGAFERATALAFDLSSTFGGEATNNAKILGKALQDPIKGVSSLSRVGVQFSATQKAQIANYVETNRLAKAQTLILEELERQVGGNAETGATASAKLKTAFDNLQEVFGTKILAVFADDLEVLARGLKTLAESPAFKEFSEEFGLAIQELVKSGALKQLVKDFTGLLKFMRENNITLIDLAKGFVLLSSATGLLASLAGPIISYFSGLDVGAKKATKSIYTNADALNDLYYGQTAMEGVFDDSRIAQKELDDQLKKQTISQKEYNKSTKALNDSIAEATKKSIELDKQEQKLNKAIREGKIGRDDLYKGQGRLNAITEKGANSFKKLGGNIANVAKIGLKLGGVLTLITVGIDLVIGFIRGFGAAWDEYFGAKTPADAARLEEILTKVGNVLDFISGVIQGIGEILGRTVAVVAIGILETFNFIYDVVEGIINFFKDPAWNKGVGESNSLYGSDTTSPTYTPYSAPKANTSKMMSNALVVNVNALAPSPEIGRSVVAAIKDYERTSGRRYA